MNPENVPYPTEGYQPKRPAGTEGYPIISELNISKLIGLMAINGSNEEEA